MNKFFIVTLYTVMILTSFFQPEITESQQTSKYIMHMMVDPGGG
ncbi:hypothetical protein IIQ_05236 [Bacillus cereus VD118]|uniref:Uncharacterized protein n=2 Tax=Bacillus cereus group TaxID=86661 RepID=R8QA44_BACCE|nr:hypothetical protein IIQ_05236 [Bacillus cereus VD118]CAH2465196.1 hypothetical protein ACOSJ1_EBGNOMHC_05443 [Bacillus mycoides KBAB4]VXC87707.1 conserved hypothetical protein [Bacillus mycoides]